ncbi:MAG: hypothetical protein V1865_02795 [bacterium]
MNTKTFFKSLPKPLIWVLIAIVILNFNFLGHQFWSNVKADTAATSVTVGNTVPDFTTNPAEATASHSGTGLAGTADNPINEGASISFNATANDDNGDDWYLAVCKTDVINPGTGGGAPTCDTSSTWCISEAANDDAQASCTYSSATGSGDSQAWYAFACDAASSGQACSVNSNGGTSGNNGSPFYLNHRPAMTIASDNSGKDPGETVTWSSTSSDEDDDAAADTFEMYVCTTAAFTGGSTKACDVSEICHSTAPVTSNAGCTYDLDSILPDETRAAYPYVIDNHGLVSTGSPTGVDTVLVINNTSPTISDSTILLKDGGGDLTLTEESGETLDFLVDFTVTDTNSCENASATDEIVSATINVYRSSVASGCDLAAEDDDDDCYFDAGNVAETSAICNEVGSCGGTSDSTIEWQCEFPLKYHADSTVAGAPTYSADNWLVDVEATDDDSATTGSVTDADGAELDILMMYDVEASLAFSSVSAGNDSADKTVTFTSTGNLPLDALVSSYNSTTDMCTDYPTCAGGSEYKIAIGQMAWGLSDVSWDSMTVLTTSAADTELALAKTTVSGTGGATPATADVHWKIRVPGGQAAGDYTGQNAFTAKQDD